MLRGSGRIQMREVLLVSPKFLRGWERMGAKAQAGRGDTSSAVIEGRPVTDLIRISTLLLSPEQFPKNCQELLNFYTNQRNFSSLMT